MNLRFVLASFLKIYFISCGIIVSIIKKSPCLAAMVTHLSILSSAFRHFYVGCITNSQYDQLPVALIAQLVEHYTDMVACSQDTDIAEVMGSVDLPDQNFFFLLDPDSQQLHIVLFFFLGLGALFCCSFFCPLDQPCKTLQTVQVAPRGFESCSSLNFFSGFLFAAS